MCGKDLHAGKRSLIAGWGGYPLIGSRDQVADGLLRLSKIGIDGIVLSWPRYIEDMHCFQRETLPLLKQAGLR
jgi:FMNH2-dependent dimethyl sulfone monooxygenase